MAINYPKCNVTGSDAKRNVQEWRSSCDEQWLPPQINWNPSNYPPLFTNMYLNRGGGIIWGAGPPKFSARMSFYSDYSTKNDVFQRQAETQSQKKSWFPDMTLYLNRGGVWSGEFDGFQLVIQTEPLNWLLERMSKAQLYSRALARASGAVLKRLKTSGRQLGDISPR